jgi:hypothetical protein
MHADFGSPGSGLPTIAFSVQVLAFKSVRCWRSVDRGTCLPTLNAQAQWLYRCLFTMRKVVVGTLTFWCMSVPSLPPYSRLVNDGGMCLQSVSEESSSASSSSDEDALPRTRGVRGRGPPRGRGRGAAPAAAAPGRGRGRGGRGRGRGGAAPLSLLDEDVDLSRPPRAARRRKPGPFAPGVAPDEDWVDPEAADFPKEVILPRVQGLPPVTAQTDALGALSTSILSILQQTSHHEPTSPHPVDQMQIPILLVLGSKLAAVVVHAESHQRCYS